MSPPEWFHGLGRRLSSQNGIRPRRGPHFTCMHILPVRELVNRVGIGRRLKGHGAVMMRAMRAESFTGYGGLKLVEVPKPRRADGRVLVRITAAGVTPLDHTILSGKFPHHLKAPLVLGNEGAGVVQEGGGTVFPAGSRVMFFGAYGAFEDGTYSEWLAVRKKDLCLIPDGIDDTSAAGIPVAYLTAQVGLTRAGFRAGKTALAPAT